MQNAREKEKRIEVLHRKAAARIQNAGILRGWTAWQDKWAERARFLRMIASAGARLLRPKLAASLALWKEEWMKYAGAKTQHGTIAQGLPRASAQETTYSVAWSGCMAMSTEQWRRVCRSRAESGGLSGAGVPM